VFGPNCEHGQPSVQREVKKAGINLVRLIVMLKENLFLVPTNANRGASFSAASCRKKNAAHSSSGRTGSRATVGVLDLDLAVVAMVAAVAVGLGGIAGTAGSEVPARLKSASSVIRFAGHWLFCSWQRVNILGFFQAGPLR
jgi:hypothetical protein